MVTLTEIGATGQKPMREKGVVMIRPSYLKDLLALSRDALVFYQSLGFERLPLNTDSIPADKPGLDRSMARQVNLIVSQSNRFIVSQSNRFTVSQSNRKTDELRSLSEEIGDCQRCKLSKQRKNIVFGEGSPETPIMFIGEAPGSDEDIQGRPFVGEAGKLLTRLINKMGFKRTDVYIANIVKCRPPFNRDPEEDEISTCFPFLKRQIEIISPGIIVSLGRISAWTILKTKIPITKLRGRFYEYEGIPVMPTFHPAYLLRNPKDKWLVWSDMQQVLYRLGLGDGK